MELAYFLKVNLALVLFYAFYRLCCTRDTFFRLRRFTLLAFWAVAWLYPLMNMQGWMQQQKPVQELAVLYAENIYAEPTLSEMPNEGISFTALAGQALLYLYLAGVVFFLLRFLLQLSTIARLAWRSPIREYNGANVHLLKDNTGPFSFFGWIFVHPSMLENSREANEILDHELTHVQQWHSIDVILSELNCILCWMNPFSYLLKREVRHNLEYLADQHVLATGHDTKTYQYHLLGLAHHKAIAPLYNHFNVLPLKKRIIMMNKKRTRKIGQMKYAGVFLPLAAALMLLSNIETVARTTRNVYTQLTEELVPVSTPEHTPASVDLPEALLPVSEAPMVMQAKASAAPLVVLDGRVLEVNVENFDFEKATNEEYAKALKFDVNQLESVTVLKDEAATAKYGEDGKNGVIELVTKNPKEAIVVSAQKKEATKSNDPDKIYSVVEEQPCWNVPGGQGEKNAAMYKFLAENMNYPENAIKKGIQGKVFVRFQIEKDGSVAEPTIVRSLDPETDAEAVRVISIMPKWIPGKMNGKVVRCYFVLPITFKLDEPAKK